LQFVAGHEEPKIMTEKIILEDGTEKEILTDDEVKDLKAGHDANVEKKPIVEQYNKAVESLELKEGQTVEERLTELKEAENPNWQKMRSTLKTLRDAAKEKDIEIDGEGNIVDKKEGLTKEETEKIAEDAVLKTQKRQQKEKALSEFDKEDAKTIGEVFDRLDSVGGTFKENMELAVEKVLPGQGGDLLKQAIGSSGGTQPRQPKKDAASSELKEFGAKNFGLKDEDFKNAE